MSSSPASHEELIKTAIILEDFGEKHKAAGYYARAGEYAKAARLFEASGDFLKAGDSYCNAKKWYDAIKMYTRTGKRDRKIAELHEKCGNLHLAAQIWKSLGNKRNWKRCLQKSRQLTLFDFKK